MVVSTALVFVWTVLGKRGLQGLEVEVHSMYHHRNRTLDFVIVSSHVIQDIVNKVSRTCRDVI